MDENGHFDWRKLGKPDYAQCHALVASLPPQVRQKISGVSTELLVRVLHLSWTFAYRSGRGNGYCWPTLATLGKYLARSVRTVERHLTRLQASGLLRWKIRRTATNGFTSNIYIIGNTVLASLFARFRKKPEQNHRTTSLSHNDLKREYKAEASLPTTGTLKDYLEKLRQEREPFPLKERLAGA